MSKSRIREVIKKRLNSQSKEEGRRKSRVISRKLFALQAFKRAKVIMFYVSKDGEVETGQMMEKAQKKGKEIVIPHINRKTKKMLACQFRNRDEDLSKGPYGILQLRDGYKKAVRPESIDMIIVPGIAFSRDGRRLGRGGGYFDRFLGHVRKNTLKVGLAFDFQIIEDIPFLSHDKPVDLVISA